MSRPDLLVYAAHGAFWLVFVAGDFAARRLVRSASPAVPTIHEGTETLRARHADLLIGAHMIAFGVMYFGVGNAVFNWRIPSAPPGRRALGAAIILLGAILISWARASFASWRLRAELKEGHQLATSGPFRIIRHPIYAAIDLLALGTAIWLSTWIVWLGAALVAVAGDLRARAEEPLLEHAFGDTYREYSGRTHRFVPGLY